MFLESQKKGPWKVCTLDVAVWGKATLWEGIYVAIRVSPGGKWKKEIDADEGPFEAKQPKGSGDTPEIKNN